MRIIKKINEPELRYRMAKIIQKRVIKFSGNEHWPDIVAFAILNYLKNYNFINMNSIKKCGE